MPKRRAHQPSPRTRWLHTKISNPSRFCDRARVSFSNEVEVSGRDEGPAEASEGEERSGEGSGGEGKGRSGEGREIYRQAEGTKGEERGGVERSRVGGEVLGGGEEGGRGGASAHEMRRSCSQQRSTRDASSNILVTCAPHLPNASAPLLSNTPLRPSHSWDFRHLTIHARKAEAAEQ